MNTNKKRKLVYVAGPYRGNTKQNIAKAERKSIELIREGYDVITPHKNTAGYEKYEDGFLTYETWIEMDLNILSRCDAICVMKNSEKSEGTQIEIAFAIENMIEIILEDDGLEKGTN